MKTKKLAVFLLSVASVFAMTFGGISVYQKVKAEETKVDNVIAQMESEYKVGTSIEIPDAYFENGGNRVKANKTVIYPNGSQYRVNKFTPDLMGSYAVEYSAIVNGQYLTETKEIYVYSDLYEVSNAASTVYYGTNELTPNTYGLNIGLQSGQIFSYNNVIDLKELNGNPFISFYMAPEKIKEADGFDFIITLTDAYDSENYVNIRVCNTSEVNTYEHFRAYLSAGAAFQPLVGYEGETGKIFKNQNWGFGHAFTFYGCDASGNPNEELITSKRLDGQLQLSFNLEEKTIKTQGSPGGFTDITDLDDPKYYTDLWDGFTTGEVYLSIKAKTVYKSRLNIVVTELGDDDITVNKCVDTTKPFISVDTLGYDELPHAVVGQSYPVFDFEAKDAYDGLKGTSVAVYRNYGSPSQSNVNFVNGKFIPTVPGNYYIVYSATDYSGNIGEKVLTVVCDSVGEEILLSVPTEGRITAANVGEYVELPTASAEGGTGNVDVTVRVTDGNGNEVAINENSIVPTSAGTYTVTYTAKDFVGTEKEYSYTINISLSNKPVFVGKDPVFAKYIISGYEYVLPEYKAFDYANGGKEMPVTVKITDDNGERTLASDRKVAFTVKDVGAVKSFKVKYEASNANGTTTKEFPVTVLSAKQLIAGNQRLDISKYFYTSSSVQSLAEARAIKLTATADGTAEFINPLLAAGFSMDFTINNPSTNGTVKIVLEDSLDATQRVELILGQMANQKTSCQVVGGLTYEVPISYTSGAFTFVYNATDKTASFDKMNYIALKKTDGSDFNGFDSGKLRVYVEFVDVENNVSVNVTRINMQNLSSGIVTDRVSPRITTAGEQTTRIKKKGEIITLYSAIGADVIDPIVNAVVSVIAPDGKPATSIDGIVLQKVDASREYQFEVSQYGNYRITYRAVDLNDNEAEKVELLNVLDVEAPSVTLSRENITTAKIGSVVVLAPVTVSDDYTATENIFVRCYIIRPIGNSLSIDMTTSNSFVANELGTWIIRYMVMDEASNITIIENKLTVTE